MPKVSLTIDKNYCSDWGVWAAIRELLQNAKDAEEYEGHDMVINHYPRTMRLEITTLGVQVNPAALLVLGKTSKADGTQRGRFGEGFCLAVLALTRAGHDIRFKNYDMSWRCSFETPDPGHPLEGNELLTFHSHKLQIREQDFKIEIDGISTEVWDALKKLVLFLEVPKASEVVRTSYGTVLMNAEYKGRVYARGLFVKSFTDLECGYDLHDIKLDRDRQMIDEWSLHNTLSYMWNDMYAKDTTIINRMYNMVKESAPETRNLRYRADDKLLAGLKAEFEAEHGDRAVPVTTTLEARDAASIGAKPAMVAQGLKEILANAGLSLETAKKKLEGVVLTRHIPTDLDEAAQTIVRNIERVVPNLSVVTFAGAAACHLIDAGQIVGVDERLLHGPYRDVLTLALAVEGRRTGLSPFDLLLTHIAGPALRLPQNETLLDAPTPVEHTF